MKQKRYIIAFFIICIAFSCSYYMIKFVSKKNNANHLEIEKVKELDKNDLSLYIGKKKEEMEKALDVYIATGTVSFGKIGALTKGKDMLGEVCYLSDDDLIQAVAINLPRKNQTNYHIDGIYCWDLIDDKKDFLMTNYEQKSIINSQIAIDYYLAKEKELELILIWEEDTRKIHTIIAFKPEYQDTFIKIIKDVMRNGLKMFEEILENSNKEIISDEVLKNMLPRELFLARWEIYARYGLCFSDPDLEKYFYMVNWYKPNGNITDPKQIQLNEYEKENIRKIDEILKTKKGKENNYRIAK